MLFCLWYHSRYILLIFHGHHFNYIFSPAFLYNFFVSETLFLDCTGQPMNVDISRHPCQSVFYHWPKKPRGSWKRSELRKSMSSGLGYHENNFSTNLLMTNLTQSKFFCNCGYTYHRGASTGSGNSGHCGIAVSQSVPQRSGGLGYLGVAHTIATQDEAKLAEGDVNHLLQSLEDSHNVLSGAVSGCLGWLPHP